jgi:plasmid stabilization system protein ParE
LAYHVDITEAALADAEEYVRFLEAEKQEPRTAESWWNGLIDAVLSFEKMPERCPVIPEASFFPETLPHLIYHSHRIIFHVSRREKTVTILRVYHASRRQLTREPSTKSARKSSQ